MINGLLIFFLFSSSFAYGFLEQFKAYRAFTNADFDKAAAYLDEVIIDQPANFQALYNRGKSAFAQKDYRSAQAYFAQAAESHNKQLQEQSLFDLGNAQVKTKAFKEALESYEKVLKINPENTYAQKMIEEIKKYLESEEQNSEQNQQQQNQDKKENRDTKENKENQQDNKQQNQDANSQKDNEQNQEQKDKGSGEENKSDAENSQESDAQDKPNNEENAEPHEQQSENKPQQGDPGKQKESERPAPAEQLNEKEKKQVHEKKAAEAQKSDEQEEQERLEEAAQGDKETFALLKALENAEKNNAKRLVKHSLQGMPRDYGQKSW